MKRSYTLILVSTLVSSVLFNMQYPIMSILAQNISGDYLFSGMIFAFPFIITVLMSYGWGAFSDRIQKRKVLIITSGIIGSLFFFIFPHVGIYGLLAARSLQSVFFASSILTTTLVTEYYPERKGRAIGGMNVWGGIGGMLGGILFGFIIHKEAIAQSMGEMISFFYFCGFLSLASILVLLPIREGHGKSARRTKSSRFNLNKQITLVCAASFIVITSCFLIYGIFPAYLSKQYSMDTVGIGLLMAASSGFGIIGSWLAGVMTDRFGRRHVFTGAMVVYVCAALVYSNANSLYIFALVWSIPIWPFFWISGLAIISDNTRKSSRGRGIGLLNSVSMGAGGFLGSILSGYLLDIIGFQNLCFLAAVLAGVATMIALGLKESKRSTIDIPHVHIPPKH